MYTYCEYDQCGMEFKLHIIDWYVWLRTTLRYEIFSMIPFVQRSFSLHSEYFCWSSPHRIAPAIFVIPYTQLGRWISTCVFVFFIFLANEGDYFSYAWVHIGIVLFVSTILAEKRCVVCRFSCTRSRIDRSLARSRLKTGTYSTKTSYLLISDNFPLASQ